MKAILRRHRAEREDEDLGRVGVAVHARVGVPVSVDVAGRIAAHAGLAGILGFRTRRQALLQDEPDALPELVAVEPAVDLVALGQEGEQRERRDPQNGGRTNPLANATRLHEKNGEQ